MNLSGLQCMNITDPEGGIINVNKPAGMTSFRVVDLIRRCSGIRKAGHAGTLDPFATGVLLVCLGKATKRVSELMNYKKTYEGVIELGATTDTDDIDGKQLAVADVPDFTEEEITTALAGFHGAIEQVPPMFSALKKNGKRLYRLARKGQILERPARPVHIYHIDLLQWANPFVSLRVQCSRGTYIRALARDVGAALGTGGFLRALKRTEIGPFRLDQDCSLKTIQEWYLHHASVSLH